MILIGTSFGFCFALLIVGDWWIAKSINSAIWEQEYFKEARLIETKRQRDEDIAQIEKLISKGYLPTLFPSLMDALVVHYPLIAGLPLTKTFYCNEGYGVVSYTSDRFGFRNDDEIWNDDIEAIMIGDSFVHGACVSDEDTLPQKLSKKISSHVINLGMGSTNPSHYVTYSYLFIPKLKPQIVYLNFYANDNGFKSKSIIEQKYVDQNIEIFSKNDLALSEFSFVRDEGIRAISFLKNGQSITEQRGLLLRIYSNLIKHSRLPTIQSVLNIGDIAFEQTKKSITKTLELCSKFDCKVIVSFIPNSEYWRPDSRADSYAEKIAQLTSRLDIPFVDGRSIINRKKGSRDFAIKGPHLSPLGYEKMAEAIAEISQ